MSDFPDVRLHVVTGKGGTGKTTVAAALALALARDRRRVLLLEVEGRQGIAQLFDVPPLTYAERRVAIGPGGGEVHAMAVDPEPALLDYLEIYNLKRAGRALKRLGAIDFATTIAPGMRDVLLTGKAKTAVIEKGRDGRPTWDAVVMDAPPTGRITRFLNVSSEVAGLAKVGPIRNQADGVMAVLRSQQTAVHLVTVLEEMPVQETIDGVAELSAADLPVGSVIVNMTRAPLLGPADLADAAGGALDRSELGQGLKSAGVEPTEQVLDALVNEAGEHARRVALEERERAELAALGRPTYELAMLSEAVDLSCLYELAESLCRQGAA
ncbi:MAG: ArsA-related P-loop ATPase [Mycobacteriales bacterium]